MTSVSRTCWHVCARPGRRCVATSSPSPRCPAGITSAPRSASAPSRGIGSGSDAGNRAALDGSRSRGAGQSCRPTGSPPELYPEHRPNHLRRQDNSDRNLRIPHRSVEAGHRTSRTLTTTRFSCGTQKRSRPTRHLADQGGPVGLRRAVERCPFAARLTKHVDHSGPAGRKCRRPLSAGAFLERGWRHFQRREGRRHSLKSRSRCLQAARAGFLSPADYTSRPADFVGVCLINLGRHHGGVRATLRSVSLDNLKRDRPRANLQWVVEQI